MASYNSENSLLVSHDKKNLPSGFRKPGNNADQRDMHRMGKTQQTERNFGFLSVFGFIIVLMATWESQLVSSKFELTNGGSAGAIWMYLATFAGIFLVIMSMAEMVSMAPTSGGQYHWVSEFAPKSMQRGLCYVVGWLCVLAWQATAASVSFVAGAQIQGILILNLPNYEEQPWHGTMLAIAVATVSLLFNTCLIWHLPLVEAIAVIFHICGFFAVIVVLWVLGPHNSGPEVFTKFSNGGGWDSLWTSCLVSMPSGVFCFLGADSAAHIAEEVSNAAYILPRAMFWTIIINGGLGFALLITFCYCMGDLETALASPTGFPFIQVFYNATGSITVTAAMTSMGVILAIFCSVATMATASRQLFAFARDRGVPASSVLSYVPVGWKIPMNSILATYACTILLTLINLGSKVALDTVLSLSTGALISSYLVSISCILMKRLRGEALLASQWSLKGWGLFVNLASVTFLMLVFVMIFFPQTPHPKLETMNWSVLVFGAVGLLSILCYVLYGSRNFCAPVDRIKHEPL